MRCPDAVGGGRLLCGISFFLVWCVPAAAQRADESLRVVRSPVTGHATFISARDGGAIPVGGVTAGMRVEPAQFLATHGRWFGITDGGTQLREQSVRRDALGHTHTTFDQVHEGIPVFAGRVKVHQDPIGQIYAANGHFFPIDRHVPTRPVVTLEQAFRAAVSKLEVRLPSLVGGELVVVDPGWYGDPSLGAQLAWHFVVQDPEAGLQEAFFVEAGAGKIIDRWSLLHAARHRQIFDGGGADLLPGTLARAEGDLPAASDEVNLAYDYAGDTYDYFARAFGRDGLDDAGRPVVVTVNSFRFGCPNAYWDVREQQVGICPGVVFDDVLAHELTHGITQYTANLIYQNQPGQLNESFSDVFGELVDLFNGDAAFVSGSKADPMWPPHDSGAGLDAPNLARSACSGPLELTDGVRWVIAEEFGVLGRAIRDMWMPECYGLPDRANHPYQLCQIWDNGGVHRGSSIPNHAFAILTDGATFNGYTIQGIGPIKSGAVWYRALTEYLTVAANFQDAYVAMNQAAADLVGTFPNDPRTGFPSDSMFTETDAVQVDLALRATEMDTPGACGLAAQILDPGEPPSCGNKTVLYFNDFETEAAGWSVWNTALLTAYDWVLTDELPRYRSGTAFFCDDAQIGDCADIDESALHFLATPELEAPARAKNLTARFTHYLAAEPGIDGGRVEISVNDGSWEPLDGEHFLFNPYNALLQQADINTNPLAGAEAFTAAGGEWGTSLIDLTPYASGGDRFRIRFAFGKDGCVGSDGWYIDDFEVYACPDCNRNGRIDSSDVRFTVSSPAFRPFGIANPVRFSLPSPPLAAGDVAITISTMGDFAGIQEEVEVRLNGQPVGKLFATGRECPPNADTGTVTAPAEMFNKAAAAGECVVEVLASPEVSDSLCGPSGFLRVFVDYPAIVRDGDGNDVPDECENCAVPLPPATEERPVLKNRYVSFVPENAGRWTALRLTVTSLPAPFVLGSHASYWVDQPWRSIPVKDSQPEALARLSCDPVFLDWGAYSVVHIGDRAIIPGAEYQLEAIDLACVPPDADLDASFRDPYGSTALVLGTADSWGDVIGDTINLPPNAHTDALDIAATVDAVIQRPNAIDFSRTDLFPEDPDGRTDVLDISTVVDAIKGFPYPFAMSYRCD